MIFLTDGGDFCNVRMHRGFFCDVVLSEVTLLKDGNLTKNKITHVYRRISPGTLYRSCRIFPTMPQLLYKRDITETNHIWFNREIRLGEVYEFTIRVLASKLSKVKVTSDCFFFLFYYVLRSSSATHKPNFLIDLTIVDTLKQYELHSNGLNRYTSFQVTAFKMLMSFTYNKYVKLRRLDDKIAVNTVETILCNQLFHKYISKVAYARKVPVKERILALYVLLLGVFGYKMLSKLKELLLYEKIH